MKVESFLEPGPWPEVVEAARGAEAAGFDSVATPEIANDPFLTLCAAAQQTERIGLRTAIAVAFPRSPMVVANSAWDLQENSGGRFELGLGTQVKGHNERRFSVPWAKPATRLREYVESLRAIWRCWQKGERLQYEGEFYNFSLMTPEFSRKPNDLPMVPVHTAAVRPRMLKLSGEIADGVRLHGFATRKYLETVAVPAIEEGLESRGHAREQFQICGGGFIVTGPDDAAVAKRAEWARYRVSFYASTRTYRPVLDAHDLGDLGDELHEMSRTNRWKEMPGRVTDDVLRLFCAIGRYDEIAAAIEARFGGLSDSVELPIPGGEAEAGALTEVAQDVRRIPTRFTGYADGWAD